MTYIRDAQISKCLYFIQQHQAPLSRSCIVITYILTNIRFNKINHDLKKYLKSTFPYAVSKDKFGNELQMSKVIINQQL